MPNGPLFRSRKIIRLDGYDYSQSGGYFVTICAREKDCVFGEMDEDGIRLSPIGMITKRCWEEIPKHFEAVELDEFVVMPNHFHGIILLKTACRGVQLNAPTPPTVSITHTRISPSRGSLSVIIRTFKAAVTTECRINGYPEFAWQRGFYDHIIREGEDLNRIRKYIDENPTKWLLDENNLDRSKKM